MTDSRHEALAAHVGCRASEVEDAFGNLIGFALWAAERSETGVAKKEAAKLHRIADELDKVPGLDFSDIRDEVRMRANAAKHFTDRRAYPATKGRKERARVIACAVARLFAATGRNIGLGKDAYTGEPSTPFGRAVKEALAIYGVQSGWYRPAEHAARNTN